MFLCLKFFVVILVVVNVVCESNLHVDTVSPDVVTNISHHDWNETETNIPLDNNNTQVIYSDFIFVTNDTTSQFAAAIESQQQSNASNLFHNSHSDPSHESLSQSNETGDFKSFVKSSGNQFSTKSSTTLDASTTPDYSVISLFPKAPSTLQPPTATPSSSTEADFQIISIFSNDAPSAVTKSPAVTKSSATTKFDDFKIVSIFTPAPSTKDTPLSTTQFPSISTVSEDTFSIVSWFTTQRPSSTNKQAQDNRPLSIIALPTAKIPVSSSTQKPPVAIVLIANHTLPTTTSTSTTPISTTSQTSRPVTHLDDTSSSSMGTVSQKAILNPAHNKVTSRNGKNIETSVKVSVSVSEGYVNITNDDDLAEKNSTSIVDVSVNTTLPNKIEILNIDNVTETTTIKPSSSTISSLLRRLHKVTRPNFGIVGKTKRTTLPPLTTKRTFVKVFEKARTRSRTKPTRPMPTRGMRMRISSVRPSRKGFPIGPPIAPPGNATGAAGESFDEIYRRYRLQHGNGAGPLSTPPPCREIPEDALEALNEVEHESDELFQKKPRAPLVHVIGSVRITDGWEFSPCLADRSTNEYRYLAYYVKYLFTTIIEESKFKEEFYSALVDGFSEGSVIVDFVVLLEQRLGLIEELDQLRDVIRDGLDQSDSTFTFDTNETVLQVSSIQQLSPEESAVSNEPRIPQWIIAIVVISSASLLFATFFASVTLFGRYTSNRRSSTDTKTKLSEESVQEWTSASAAWDNAAVQMEDDEDFFEVPPALPGPRRVASYHQSNQPSKEYAPRYGYNNHHQRRSIGTLDERKVRNRWDIDF